jgi:glycosyltransferase involved in cell wall biosynthesis
MRILYVWDYEYPWDVRTHKICAALTRGGHDVHLTARNRKWQADHERLPEALVHRMAPLRWLGKQLDGILSFPAFMNPRWRSLISRAVRGADPDIVVVRDLPLCPTAIWVARRFGKPVVLDMAENYPAMMRDIWTAGRRKAVDLLVRNPSLVAFVERYCLARLDHVIVVVEESGQRLEGLGLPSHRISVVSNTPPRSRAMQETSDRVVLDEERAPGGQGEPVRLVYLGLMEIPRGVGEVLEALNLLRAEGASVHATLIGGGRDLEHFEAHARALGLSDDEVQFLGYVPNEEALEIVARSDIGLIPHHANESWNTTIPNKLFDYMAAGLGVVTSDAEPCARVVRDSGAGAVFRSGDARDLARCVAELLDPKKREEKGQAGRRAVLERYHWERDVAVLVGALQEVVAHHAGAVRRPD